MKLSALAIALALAQVDGFHVSSPGRLPARTVGRPGVSLTRSPLFVANKSDEEKSSKPSVFKRVLNRLDTIEAAGLEDVKVAGLFQRVKDTHNPITYLVLALMAGYKWRWCFRNPYYWFAVAFCVKWYRARYVFKIPVWDRQPNWNNIITSKEQEKDLKAFTCKNCGSTIFIAKTREFFFEGNTGIGGLGCFSCGAKGKDNFVMDRDRIVEDVADVDDYFEYERPLDFVSRAERRKILKEAGGSEDKANEILMNRATGETDAPPAPETTVNGDEKADIVEAEVVSEDIEEEVPEDVEETLEEDVAEEQPVAKKETPKEEKKEAPKKISPPPSTDDLDALDMDAF